MKISRYLLSAIVVPIAILFGCGAGTNSDNYLDAPSFAMKYFTTPVNDLKNLSGVKLGDDGSKGAIYFECDSAPSLKDASSYKPGVDLVYLADHFYGEFPDLKTYPLFHSSEVDGLAMEDGMDQKQTMTMTRVLMHNRKTKGYFFSNGGYMRDLPIGVGPIDLSSPVSAEHPEEFYLRGVAYARNHKSDSARADFSDAIRLVPDCANAYFARGAAIPISEKSREKGARTIADYKKALEFAPDSFQVRYALMSVYLANKESDLAQREAATLIKLRPRSKDEIEGQLKAQPL